MELKLEDGSIVVGCKKVNKKTDIIEGKRVFYELRSPLPTGVFKEIYEIKRWLEGDKELEQTSYIDHHNFHIEM